MNNETKSVLIMTTALRWFEEVRKLRDFFFFSDNQHTTTEYKRVETISSWFLVALLFAWVNNVILSDCFSRALFVEILKILSVSTHLQPNWVDWWLPETESKSKQYEKWFEQQFVWSHWIYVKITTSQIWEIITKIWQQHGTQPKKSTQVTSQHSFSQATFFWRNVFDNKSDLQRKKRKIDFDMRYNGLALLHWFGWFVLSIVRIADISKKIEFEYFTTSSFKTIFHISSR